MTAISFARQAFGPNVIMRVKTMVSLFQLENRESDPLLILLVAINDNIAFFPNALPVTSIAIKSRIVTCFCSNI